MSQIVAQKAFAKKPDLIDQYGKYVPYVVGGVAIVGVGVGAYLLYQKFGKPVEGILGIPSAILEGVTGLVEEGKVTKEEAILIDKTMQDAYELALVRMHAAIYWQALEELDLPLASPVYQMYKMMGLKLDDLVEAKKEERTLEEEIAIVDSYSQTELDQMNQDKSDALKQMSNLRALHNAEQEKLDTEQRLRAMQYEIEQAGLDKEEYRRIQEEHASLAREERARQNEIVLQRERDTLAAKIKQLEDDHTLAYVRAEELRLQKLKSQEEAELAAARKYQLW